MSSDSDLFGWPNNEVTHPLTQEQKDDWVAALRSGEYQQGAGQLVKHHEVEEHVTYCCLGVLLTLTKPEGVSETSAFLHKYGQPAMVQPSMQHELASLNDGGLSFSEIADFIEATPLDVLNRTQKLTGQ